MFPKDFSCEAVPWNNSDDRSNILTDATFPVGFKFETDTFYIKDSKTGFPLDGRIAPAKDIHLKIILLNQRFDNDMYFQYKGAVRFENTWELIEPIVKDGLMEMKVERVESFCFISFIPDQTVKISTDGGQFVSTVDSKIRVQFPAGSVKQETSIGYKVQPVDINCFTEGLKQEEESIIYAISPFLSTNHMELKRPVTIHLPLQYIPETGYDENDYKFSVFKLEEDGSLELTNIDPLVENRVASFDVSSFCGYSVAAVSRSTSTSTVTSTLQEKLNLKKWCKMLFFVGEKKDKYMQIMLECVEKSRISEVCENRKEYGYNVVTEWISKDFFLSPDKSRITVDVKGIFSIPKQLSVRRPVVTFVPKAVENFTRFPVDLNQSAGGRVHGILTFKIKRELLDEIYYDPMSTKTIPMNRNVRKASGNRKQAQAPKYSAAQSAMQKPTK
ncbi:Hypothetical predicted protein [Mytilus galloprovincialis]|uniref:Uncharacterized protein n=1 Tax=Mytilus galloprovincialis TaxID=29158 RepID=A0A8B6FDV9_MYTGA|nr:Hypothetical predicted protein [Mytilus galloprovincialis]